MIKTQWYSAVHTSVGNCKISHMYIKGIFIQNEMLHEEGAGGNMKHIKHIKIVLIIIISVLQSQLGFRHFISWVWCANVLVVRAKHLFRFHSFLSICFNPWHSCAPAQHFLNTVLCSDGPSTKQTAFSPSAGVFSGSGSTVNMILIPLNWIKW